MPAPDFRPRSIPGLVRAAIARRYRHYRRVDLWLREYLTVHRYRIRLERARREAGYAELFRADTEPLVSVCVSTYNRARLLLERSVASALRQTHRNLEILVVGDHCTDDTEERLGRTGDQRIRFVNLPTRGSYPPEGYRRWLVAGVAPANAALELARGEWLAPLDDDDEFTEDHVATLLASCRARRLEMGYGIARSQDDDGAWLDVGSPRPRWGRLARSAVLYWSGLSFMRYNPESWKMDDPADWNLWRGMMWSGVRIGFVDRVVTVHHRERTQWGR